MFDDKNYNQKMDKTFDVFTKELSSLRTGRANSNMLDLVKVDVYGQKMPINQLATITIPESRLISVQVWDRAFRARHKDRSLLQSLCPWLGASTRQIRSARTETP